MEQRGPWTRHTSTRSYATNRFDVFNDEVTRPDGQRGQYPWVQAPDHVRVAALVEGHLLIVEQYHYLVGRLWQLPGGAIDPADADPQAAARRELAEETGYHGGTWREYGSVYPLPGLTDARTHLWLTMSPSPGPTNLEGAEADLAVRHIRLHEAASATRNGLLRCAPSTALVLSLLAEGITP